MINTKDGGELNNTNVRNLREITALGEGYNRLQRCRGANKIKIIESSKQIGDCFINELT